VWRARLRPRDAGGGTAAPRWEGEEGRSDADASAVEAEAEEEAGSSMEKEGAVVVGKVEAATAAPVAAEAATQAEAVQDAGRPFVEKAVE
jgi:hypothetical protein